MPLHIEELTSEVTVIDGDQSLSEKHKQMLVELVLKKLKERGREAERKVQATELRRQAAKPLEV
jgi:pyruvate/2-oxoglutarate dehydrogenase complex dihydrolipoamide dehydrogenase (E3) component